MKYKLNDFVIIALLAVMGMVQEVQAKSIITEWNPVVIDATVKNTPQPTVGTRTMMMIFTSAYDAWAAFDNTALGAVTENTLDGTGGAPTLENMNEAVSHAIYNTILAVAPNSKPEAEAFMTSHGFALDSSSTAAVLGRTVAQRVIDSRKNDGSNQENGYADTSGYQPKPATELDSWQPLRVPLNNPEGNLQRALSPHWGKVKPFAINTVELRLPPPAEPGTARWDAQIQQVIDISANLTNEQKVIAEFWRPQRGTPPMLWGELTAVVSEQYNFDIADDAKLYFAIHSAMFDASITCWDNKYFYDYIRPVTAIRNMGDVMIQSWGGVGKGTVTLPASQWLPYQSADQPTPPFPEYTSGHSTFGGSWSEIMRQFTGSDRFGYGRTFTTLAFEGTTIEPVELYWETFTEAAQEAGMSRLYGGIHFMDANLNGQFCGKLVGGIVWHKVSKLFKGYTSNVAEFEAYK